MTQVTYEEKLENVMDFMLQIWEKNICNCLTLGEYNAGWMGAYIHGCLYSWGAYIEWVLILSGCLLSQFYSMTFIIEQVVSITQKLAQ